jgi:hypothetical protein
VPLEPLPPSASLANIKCLDLTPTFPPSETFVGEAVSFPYKTIANLTMGEAAVSDGALVSGFVSAGTSASM